MVSKRFMIVFLVVAITASFAGIVLWRLFIIERRLNQPQEETTSCGYEEIDLVMPVHAFLKRGANSSVQSYVRRLFANQWISSNQADLVKLVAYAQGATTYEELKKALLAGIDKEGATGASAFVLGAFKKIEAKPSMIEHINKSLVEGYPQEIHVLRGQMTGLDQNSVEYRKLKTQYRKQLDSWMDEKHGALLDELIAQL